MLPPLRRGFSFRAFLPLLIFLILFICTCLWLELADLVLFTRLWPFALLLLAPWLWWMSEAGYGGLSRTRTTIALVARLALLALFIILLAEPRSVRKDDRLSVVFVVDVSASVREESWREAMKYVLEIVQEKPQRDLAGLVFFGRNAAVELPPNMTLPYEDINVQVDPEGTDIAKSLRLAAAMLPEDKNGRVVLVSDGVETEGNILDAIDELKAKGVAIDVFPISYNYDEEVWIERLELPRFVKSGETYQASVILSSLTDGGGKLTLTENGRVIHEEDVAFKAGKNRYDISLYLRQPGYYEYEAQILVPDEKDAAGNITRRHDFKRENNRAVSHIYLRGKGQVLIVTDPGGDERDHQRFVEALQNAEREVAVQPAYQFPRSALALLPYDCVVFANVPASALDAQQMEAVHEAVYAQGTGFIMIGGANSYGPGGYARTPVEKALPVSMDLSQKKILPKGALVIILHTCEFPQGNTWGKNITKQAIKVLNDRDEVGVLVYDWQGGDKWLFQLTPAGEYEKLATQINNAQIGDMPTFGPTMQMALNALQNSDASVKHMIIISDGDPGAPPPGLLQSFQNNKITISTVTVFPHQGVNGPEVQLMASIAKLTGGQHYLPQNPNQLPKIFIKEATTLRRSAIQNVTFNPESTFPSPIMEGIIAVPQLHGYVLTTPKQTNKVKVILEGPEQEEVDPILAEWRYGLGAAAAWTSDLSPNWARDWVGWDKYDAFVKQLVTRISRITDEGKLRMRAFAAGGEGLIIVEDYADQAGFLEMQARVDMPDGTEKTLPLKQVGPRRYEARFPLTGQGQYRIAAVAVGDRPGDDGGDELRKERVHGGFVVPYSQEYLRFRYNPITLQTIAKRSGGEMLTGRESGQQIYGRDRRTKMSSSAVFDLFLLALAILIPLDVGLRRVQVDWATIKNMLTLGRAEQPSKETFTALLKRKHDVTETLGPKDATGAPAPPPPPRARRPAAQGPELDLSQPTRPGETPAKPQQKQQDQPPPMSMTERLLAAKRRAQEQREEDKDK